MVSDCRKVAICVGIVFGIVLFSVLLGLSIKDVSQDEWALNYGKVTRNIRGNVMGPGRYTVQPDSEFLTFKNTFVPWTLNIDCWTLDGIEVLLDIAIQTRYVAADLEVIVFEFGKESAFLPYVREVLSELLRSSCSNFTSFDYYNKRGDIQTDMTRKIDEQLPLRGTHITSGGFVQLRNIKLPDAFNQAILDKRSAEQDIQVAQNKRAQQLTIANTNLSQAINQGNILVNNAMLQANAINFDATQVAVSINTDFAKRLLVYQTGLNATQLSPDDYVSTVLLNKLIEKTGNNINVFM